MIIPDRPQRPLSENPSWTRQTCPECGRLPTVFRLTRDSPAIAQATYTCERSHSWLTSWNRPC